ncbi:MAG: hypothetical protein GC145_06095 [Caulobacter sp.]|nr:hypothetical protein [Caulobacter sp.]
MTPHASHPTSRTPSHTLAALPPPSRVVVIHLTPFAPGVLANAPLSHPSRAVSYHGVTTVQAVRSLAERLKRAPAALAFRLSALCDVEVYDPRAPADILAVILEGLSCGEAEAAREAIIRGARR